MTTTTTSKTTQITIRLPPEVLAFVDAMVSSGDGSGRAALITEILRREQRRARVAEADNAYVRRLADGTAEADPWLDSDEFAGWVKKNNDKVLDDLD